MTNPIRDILVANEWYDNHKLSMIMACRRKAFFHLLYRGGLADTVGPGAWFGFSIHAGLARYYKDWQPGGSGQLDRRAAAHRAFAKAYKSQFPEGTKVDNKHRFERGLLLLDAYFDHWSSEDALFKPVEPELGGIVTIRPEPGDPFPFDPFLFVWRADGIFERVSTGDWLVLETKTTGSGVDRELMRFELRRQTRGYVYGVQQFSPSHPVVGVLANVMLVAAEKMEFKRDYFLYKQSDIASWRAQTISIVQEWRAALGRAVFAPLAEQLDIFYQRTDACTDYGLCCFYDLCKHGAHYGLDQYKENTWIPLE